MKVLTLDPGEATGWSVWRDGELAEAGTSSLLDTIDALGVALLGDWELAGAEADPALVEAFSGVDQVVFEDWRLYPWKLKDLAMDECRTARGIGAVEFICRRSGTPCAAQPAKIKDQAVAAGAEELFARPLHENRHRNDAVMHGVVWHKLGAGAAGA